MHPVSFWKLEIRHIWVIAESFHNRIEILYDQKKSQRDVSRLTTQGRRSYIGKLWNNKECLYWNGSQLRAVSRRLSDEIEQTVHKLANKGLWQLHPKDFLHDRKWSRKRCLVRSHRRGAHRTQVKVGQTQQQHRWATEKIRIHRPSRALCKEVGLERKETWGWRWGPQFECCKIAVIFGQRKNGCKLQATNGMEAIQGRGFVDEESKCVLIQSN